MKFRQLIASSFVVAAILTSCSDDDDSPSVVDPGVENPVEVSAAVAEANLLLASIEADGGIPFDVDSPATDYPEEANVFIPSVLGVDYRLGGNGTTSNQPSVTLPMFQGIQGDGTDAYYIITESSDRAQAEQLGVIWAPRMADAIGSPGVQAGDWDQVENEDGVTVTRLVFEGSVNFGGERSLVAGTRGVDAVEGDPEFGILSFPPAEANAGATADDLWSSYVVLPSGVVINAQQVANATGLHDRIATANTGRDGQDVENVLSLIHI